MSTWLRQSTAREIKLGPFVDSTDGFTPETGLTIAQADVRLAKNEGDWAQKNETTTLVHEENGWYRCLLNATDTDSLGILIVAVNESGALPVWREFLVVTAQVWDSYLGADVLQVDVAQWLGTAVATPTVAGVPEVDVTHAAGGAQASIATQASVDAVDNFVDTEITDIQARLPAALVSGRMDANVGAMAANVMTAAAAAADLTTELQAGLATSAALATVQADTDDIQARLPAALVGGRIAANAEVVGDKTGYALAAAEYTALVNLVWDELTTEGRVASSYGQLFKDNLNAAITTRAAIADYTAVRAGKLDNLDALISSRAVAGDAMALTVAAVDLIWDEAFAELPQAQPAASPTARVAIMLLFMLARNAGQSTTTERRVRNDANTVIAKAPMSDDGVTFDQGKLVSGP